jgi:hypothetical protein
LIPQICDSPPLSKSCWTSSATTRFPAPAPHPGLTVGDHLITTISRAPHLELVPHPGINGHFRILDWRYLPYIRPM